MNIHIRWLIRRDMESVLAIEADSFEFPWPEEEFIKRLRQRNCIGMVAEWDEEIAGYFLYEMHRTHYTLINFAVHPDMQMVGVGRRMMEKMQDKLSNERRSRMTMVLREKNLDGHLFLRAMGFRAVDVLRDWWDGCDEDAYVFEYRHGGRVSWTNRIATFYQES